MVCSIKQRKTDNPDASHKQASRIPYLNGKHVCKPVFLSTLGISNKWYNYAVAKKMNKQTGIAETDERGHKTPPNKSPQDKIEFIKVHIGRFPNFTSHYGRANSRKYLSPDFSLAKMYRAYVEECETMQVEPCKLWVYQRVFNTEFNFHFYKPKSDTCRLCDKFKAKKDVTDDQTEKNSIDREWNAHLDRADLARQKLKTLQENDDKHLHCLTFDLERALPTPYLNTDEVFYMRQLWRYKLGVHTSQDGYMHMWHEGVASRGSTEVTSAWYYHYLNDLSDEIKHIVTMSDTCGWQNRNYPMA